MKTTEEIAREIALDFGLGFGAQRRIERVLESEREERRKMEDEAKKLFGRVYHVLNWAEPIEAETCDGFVSLEESSDNFEEVKEDVLTFLSTHQSSNEKDEG